MHFDVEAVVPWLAADGRGMAQGFVKYRIPQRAILIDARQLIGMLEQQVPHVQDGAAGGFAAASDDQGDVRGYFLSREIVPVDLALAELRDDVLADILAVAIVQIGRPHAS